MYREVTMVEVKEVLRLWRLPRNRLAAQLGLRSETVRRLLAAATAAGVHADGGAVTDDEVRDTLLALHPMGGGRGTTGGRSAPRTGPSIERWLGDGLRLTKIRKLLTRQGVAITYPTCIASRSPSCSLGRPRRRFPWSMAHQGRSSRSTPGGSDG